LNREPKISEIEKLIEHFRSTEREHELLEILQRHNIKEPDEAMKVINDFTHEFNEEAIVVNKIAWREGAIKKIRKPFKRLLWLYRNKWYLRFGFYWTLLFVFIFSLLNTPILLGRISSGKADEESKVLTYQELQQTPMAKSAPLSRGEVVPSGSHLKIPKLKINAPIQFPETNDEAVIQKYLTKGVVHYDGTAEPGEVGNSFITGHSSNFWWIDGKYNYIFVNLDKLKVGDQAIIYHNGNKYVYEVRSRVTVVPTDVSVLKQTETPILSLMTCTPPGTNWKRLVVKLDQISPKYTKPKLVTKTYIEPSVLPSDSNSMGAWFKSVWDAIIGSDR
jgi:LPXTG-site transpeptidase (sortase) family protein